jgi:hypothetical protein
VRFEEFWQAYPNKKGKPAALRAYKTAMKLGNGTHKLILQGIERYKKTAQWQESLATDKKHIPHPSTFLNQRRWEDEIAPAQTRHGGIKKWLDRKEEEHA